MKQEPSCIKPTCQVPLPYDPSFTGRGKMDPLKGRRIDKKIIDRIDDCPWPILIMEEDPSILSLPHGPAFIQRDHLNIMKPPGSTDRRRGCDGPGSIAVMEQDACLIGYILSYGPAFIRIDKVYT
jgi:hypothetical protein